MDYIINALYNFNLPFTLKDYSEYGEGYLATFTIDIPFGGGYGVSHKVFSNISMFISILEQKYLTIEFDSMDKNEFSLFLIGGDDTWQ